MVKYVNSAPRDKNMSYEMLTCNIWKKKKNKTIKKTTIYSLYDTMFIYST